MFERTGGYYLPLSIGARVVYARGVAQRPGGWQEWRYNVEMGPPVFAPLLVTVVGGMGLLASALRREQSL